MYRVAYLLFLAPAVLLAAPPDDIVLPVVPVPPAPPPPGPSAATTLTGDLLYVIQSKTECVVRAHPTGLVRVEKTNGPLTVRAKFVDGTGKVETRKFAGPFVYIVEATGTGRAELDIVPLGLKAETDIVSVAIDVDAGQGPIPPPKPKPDPKPDDPKPDPVTSFRVILVYESGDTLTASQNSVLYGKEVEAYLTTSTTRDGQYTGWRRRDKNAATTGDTATMNALWAAVKPAVTTTPCVAVERNGKVEIINLEPSPAKMVETLKRYAEGK